MTGVYIHIPFCVSKCNYCAFYSVADPSDMGRYLDALKNEIWSRSSGDGQIAVDTIYLGGGTPSVLPQGAMKRILSWVRERFEVTKDAEITVEANPESCQATFAKELREVGVTRVSLGLQSHDDRILRNLARPHRAKDFLHAVQVLQGEGIDNLSADLMLGLPDQTLQSLQDSIDFALQASPLVRHMSIYALTVEQGTPLHQSGYQPDEDLQADMYAAAVQRLSDCGLSRYEVSNFACCGYESRHNQKYWTGEPYFGFGVSAHSMEIVEGHVVRAENWADIRRYIQGEYEKSRTIVPPLERSEEILMLSLRTREGLHLGDYLQQTGRDIRSDKREQLNSLVQDGMVELSENRLVVTDKGMYVLSAILLKLL